MKSQPPPTPAGGAENAAALRPAVLWSWNGRMTRDRITSTIAQFAERGLGGVYIHPRPGLITEYLAEEWFSLWKAALEACEVAGLLCHIYDENSFPSGFAGGHVADGMADSQNWRLTARPSTEPAAGKCRCLATVGGMELLVEPFPADLWYGGFPLTDICRTEVTRKFLEVTHEAYAARFAGAFGKTIRHVFTDEPETGTSDEGFYFSPALEREFAGEHGYSLAEHAAALCGDLPDSPAVRHDYFFTVNRLFTGNFARLCGEWCADHDLVFTGHFREDQWPFPEAAPDSMAAQRWMQAPGMDLLAFQFFDPAENLSRWILAAKECTSIAAQCDRKDILCECSGGGGYGFGPAEMKPLEDFLLAHGFNRLVAHLSHQSLAGARKYDWPQTLSDHSPWWDSFGTHAEHLTRVNQTLSAASPPEVSLLVLHPTTTGWLHYRPACFQKAEAPAEADAILLQLRASQTALVAGLYAAGIDFHLGSELVLAALGTVRQGRLHAGSCSYTTVVIPPGMENFLSSTDHLLHDFLKAGGEVIACGPAPAFVNGREATIHAAAHPRWQRAESDPVAQLRRLHPPRLRTLDEEPLPCGLSWNLRTMPDGGSVLFLANATAKRLTLDLLLPGAAILDLETDASCPNPPPQAAHSDGVLCATVDLAPAGHALWLLSDSPQPTVETLEIWCPLPVQATDCAPCEPNVLLLVYCDYTGPEGLLTDLPTICADSANWVAQGFARNLWRVSIQYRRRFLDAPVRSRSGFEISYSFEVEPGFASSADAGNLQVAIERPELYRIFLNDVPLAVDQPSPWFDEEMALFPLGSRLRPGRNTIRLCAATFHPLAEISPVILRGPFSLVPDTAGFRIALPQPWVGGLDWSEEGWPFYPGRVRCRYAFQLAAASRIRLALPAAQASAVGLSLDGGDIVWLPHGQHFFMLPEPLAHGSHTLEFLLCGHLKNLLGPHFSNGLPGAWSWENAPAHAPPGEDYQFMPTRMHPPRLEASPVGGG